jgi:hypothetical protein
MLFIAMLTTTVLAVPTSPSGAVPSPTHQACVALTNAERNMSLFVPAESVEGVKPLREQRYRVSRSNALPIVRGAIIYVRPAPGFSVAGLQQIADCHLAEASDRQESWMTACPAFVPGATAKVRQEDGRFVVEIRSTEDSAAAEVLRRAQQIKPAPTAAHGGSIAESAIL